MSTRTPDAYHLHTITGEKVDVVCPPTFADGTLCEALTPDQAEKWAHEILAAVNRARDVADGAA